jgi:hypothetical protein
METVVLIEVTVGLLNESEIVMNPYDTVSAWNVAEGTIAVAYRVETYY